MSAAAFDKFSVGDIQREMTQIETALGHTIFNREFHQDPYAELRVLENATGLALLSPAAVLDPQFRQNALAKASLVYSPVGSPASPTPWHASFAKNPAGVAAP